MAALAADKSLEAWISEVGLGRLAPLVLLICAPKSGLATTVTHLCARTAEYDYLNL